MKKFFYCVALIAAVALTACGGGKTEQKISADDQAASGQHECVNNSEKLSAEDEAAIKSFADFMDLMLRDESRQNNDYVFRGAWQEGRDIIIAVEVNEGNLRPGMTVKTQFLNADPQYLDALADNLAKSFTNGAPPQAKAVFGVLRRCKCTIVYRYVGSISNETVDVRVPCEKFPE